MSDNGFKVEFSIGGRASTGHFFKSAFARSLMNNCRDTKSLDFINFIDNGTIAEEDDDLEFSESTNKQFYSLMGIDNPNMCNANGSHVSRWQSFNEPHSFNMNPGEMDKLRKECESLKAENRRLSETFQNVQTPRVQPVDHYLLQTQVETLQWQLRQTESNRKMYRTLMNEIVRFLERAQKSLDILHEKEKNNTKGKGSKVPRSKSVQGVDEATTSTTTTTTNTTNTTNTTKTTTKSGKRASVPDSPSGSSNGGSSKVARAKSSNQIAAPQTTSMWDFTTWSVKRRNSTTPSTPPPSKTTTPVPEKREHNKTHEGIVYRQPEPRTDIDPNTVPPEKLSEEAFRLMRTVQSLLAMREPDFARVSSPDEEEEMCLSRFEAELSLLQSMNFANSTSVNDGNSYIGGSSSSEQGSSGSPAGSESTSSIKSSTSALGCALSNSSSTLQSLLPGSRRSVDIDSLITKQRSTSSKKTKEEVPKAKKKEKEESRTTSAASTASTVSSNERRESCPPPTSTPNRKPAKKAEKKHSASRWFRSKFKLNNGPSSGSTEDESGFSSLSSGQEVGLPVPFASLTTPISPIKGCHTEVGLPEVPLEKVERRRWSSTPVEMKTILKRHSVHFSRAPVNPESVSVWV